MRSVVGAILFVGACVLIGSGLIASAITRGTGNYAQGGYAMGGIVGVISVIVMISGIGQRVNVPQVSASNEQDR